MIKFFCPSCQDLSAVSLNFADKELECPRCGKRIRVPIPDKTASIKMKPGLAKLAADSKPSVESNRRAPILLGNHLMEPDFAQWRVWVANVRDGHSDGHPVREKAIMLVHAMDAWHTSWLYGRKHPESAINLMESLEVPIQRLVKDLIVLGVTPPTKIKDTRVEKNTKKHGKDGK